MFVQAIQNVSDFTRAIHTISRNIDSPHIETSSATLFFVNKDGWALTCKHIVDQFVLTAAVLEKRQRFLAELEADNSGKNPNRLRKKLMKAYGYPKKPLYEIYNCFMGCVEGNLEIEYFMHPEIDLALIHFVHYSDLLCDTFPVFAEDGNSLLQGKYLCKLGYPFPEFTNYRLNTETDSIEWTEIGRIESPRFPLEGMVTRLLIDDDREVFGFEMSTPGLRGQSGGPVFDRDGKIWGMQYATRYFDLNFDIEENLNRNGKMVKVREHEFLYVGNCIHVDAIKDFMRSHNVEFAEG
ncbi:trypsin-like peptidase domain-containing protein [Brucepastera parasyntrophica]|uniref:trypsin-like peptidase domain-containing protein n=1 Tax=Brucepastera parasyntrophica TaxID=2880008 RepID=UPI00210CB549|nr:trypsin-like peptidase domain-containing protein [Brucepastera parasyntrophica]ULQ60239.1 trypsin-like peptidase domain-containing protein [Brucepastera parasyntrophica]